MVEYQRIENKRVLVTGGAGFIGSNLCEDMLKYDNEMVCLDNFSTGRMENIREMLDHKRFKLVVGDIRILVDCNKMDKGIDINSLEVRHDRFYAQSSTLYPVFLFNFID